MDYNNNRDKHQIPTTCIMICDHVFLTTRGVDVLVFKTFTPTLTGISPEVSQIKEKEQEQ